MTIGERIKERLGVLEMSQAELARRVGLSQPAINSLIRGASRSSTHLHRIARELGTTPAYLTGETDDVAKDAPPPAPIQFVMLPVALPPVEALAAMFEGLLATADQHGPAADLALQLAQRLPIGLSQLQDLRIASATLPARSAGSASIGAARATADLEPRR
ncbi:XRE family transcriptional regulator [Sphingomonas sp. MA1305]|uniref:helix-turn-helix domain-containing protein n=1 Tax=Sphingomonas sp. MA1305 TaxID=2479204 RepID=UPI0018DF14F6|nr:helix-turn-helix transcriptional regulator [Sphingomonas sp. MA1305]MBI0475392.1 XRE family transcriptional regulator [Sphingomonas sp. MA1305]